MIVDRLPLTVLTGFLGSGKTTLLRAALASPALADTAVIINEAGEMSLDHLLVRSVAEQVFQLPSGCLCCVRRADIVDSLQTLLRQRAEGTLPPFRRVVIETSGLADPAPILYTLSVERGLAEAVACHAVVTLVDCVTGAATLRRHPEAASQVAVADRLLLTKTDLAPPSPALSAELGALNPGAELLAGGAAPAALFAAAPLRAVGANYPETAAHSHGLRTTCLELTLPPTRALFARTLARLASDRGEDLLRAKGLIAFVDRPDRVAAIHAVQHTLYPPDWLSGWPDADRRSRMVFVTRGIDADELRERFACAEPRLWRAALACEPLTVSAPVNRNPVEA